jgi:hypothetical protein
MKEMKNEFDFETIFNEEDVIQEDVVSNSRKLTTSKIIFGILLFVMIGFGSFTLAGKNKIEDVNTRAAINNLVESSINNDPDIGLVNISIHYNNLKPEEVNPVVVELNLIKYTAPSRMNDRTMRDKIIDNITNNVSNAGLNVYPILDIKFIQSYR